MDTLVPGMVKEVEDATSRGTYWYWSGTVARKSGHKASCFLVPANLYDYFGIRVQTSHSTAERERARPTQHNEDAA